MQISRAGEYGVLGLLYLVREAPDRTVMIDTVSRDESIPKSFLAKIFQDLVRVGILRSQRGAGGGFGLARPAEEISVLEIIEAIDGRIALQRCLGDEPNCERQEGCALCVLFEQAQDRLKEVFALTSLADLARQQAGRNTHRLVPRRDHDVAPVTSATPPDAAPVTDSQPIAFRQRQPRIQEIQP